jgi:16S rRNA (guanine(966)-N(2))-methyltransferase RsmD
MRIIGGEHGGRRFTPPGKMPHTRPTTDIAKEGLFNILQNKLDFSSLKTLDLFGGTGSISYELLSRGAIDLTIVEKDPAMAAFIQQTLDKLQAGNARVVKMDVFRYLEACDSKFNLIFAGPPYALATIDSLPRIIFQKQLLMPGGLFVLEHTPRNHYTGFPGFSSERNYGTTVFSFFTEQHGN